jgi:nitrogenase molybdenum-iron protein alpha/beta subunit
MTSKRSWKIRWNLSSLRHISFWLMLMKYKEMPKTLTDASKEIGRRIGNESLHEISYNNGIRVVNFAISKNSIVKNIMFPHCNIHKYKEYPILGYDAMWLLLELMFWSNILPPLSG